MKMLTTPLFRAALLGLVCTLLASHAGAVVLYWDNNGTGTPSGGTWDTSTKNWAPSSTLTTSTLAWTNGPTAAVFTAGGTSAGNITINVPSAITCAGMFANGVAGSACNPTFTGTGSFSLSSGMQGFYISSGFTISINVPITGAGGVQQQGAGVLNLYGNNTYTGGTQITGGQTLNYNNNNSFGTGTIIIGGTAGGLASTASTALTIPNNFSFPTAGWNLNLAGGLPVAGAPGTTFTGNFPLPTGTTTIYTGGTGQLIEIAGVVSGNGATLIVSDPGTMWLAGVNTYNGNTSITNTLSATGPNPTLSIIGAGSLGSGNYGGNITNAGTFIYASSAPQTLSGVISGAGTLTVSGSGAVVLPGVNTYSGATTVSGGKLVGVTGGSCASSAVTVSGTGALGVSIPDNTKQWTCAGATFNDSTTTLDFNFNFVTPSTTLAPLNVNGAATFTAAPTVTVEGGSLAVGTYPLMTWTSTSGTAPSTVILPPNVTGNLSLSGDGSTLLLNITATTEPLVWAVSGTGTWDTTTQNWFDSGTPPAAATYADGAAVVFDETYITAPTAVTLNSSVAPGAVKVNNSTYNYTISGTGGISGATGLSKQGSATLTLAGANTFTGPTTIGAGTLQLGDGVANNGSVGGSIADNASLVFVNPSAQTYWGNISGTGSLTLSGSNTVTLGGANTYSGATTINPGTALTVGGQLGGGAYAGTIADNATFTYAGPAGQTLSGVISGTGALVQNGPGALTLSGANTFSGAVSINAGTLSVNSIADTGASALGLGTALNLSGGTLSYSGAAAATTTRAVTLSGTASGVDLPSGSLEFNSQVKSGTFTKTGAGVLTLSGSTDNASLGVTVSGGKVVLNKASASAVHALGATTTVNSGGTLQLSGTGGDQIFSGVTVTVASGGVFDANGQSEGFTKLNLAGTGISSGGAVINSVSATTSTLTLSSGLVLTANSSAGGAGNLTIPSVISGAFSLTKVGAGTLTLSGANTYSTTTTISGGTLTIGGGGKLTAGTYNQAITDNGAFIYNSTAAQTLSGVISGSGTVTQNGTGTLTLSGANTYTGITTVGNGSLVIGADNNLGAAPATVVANQLTLNNNINNGANNYGLRVSTATSFSLSAKRGITLGALGGSINVQSGTTLTVPGIITGSGSFWASPNSSAGYGTIVLSGLNTYSGATFVAAGTLTLGVSGALPTGTPVTIGASAQGATGGSFFNLNGFNQTIGPLASSTGFGSAGTGTPTVQLGAGALTIFQTNATTTFAGVISGTGSVTVNVPSGGTAGTLILSGANTYTGPTTVSAATLEVSGSLASASVAVASGATLKLDNATALSSSTALVTSAGSSVNLNYAGGLNLVSLSLDGGATTVATGTWGAPGSGAVNTDARFTGTGILNVGIAPPSSVTLNSSGTPTSYGTAVTFTSVVSGSGATPTGTITFRDGATVLGAVTLDGTGTATLTTSTLNAATHSITAAYSGDVNYGAALASFSQVVSKAALTVTASNQTKTYGQTVSFGAGSTQFTSSGLQNGETIGSVTLAVSGNGGAATATVAGSPYTITPSAATGGTFNAANYTLTYATGTLTVNPAPLTVTASGLLTYGDDPSNTVYAASYTGLVNGDPSSVVTGAADYSTDATATNYIGTNYVAHVVDLGTLTAANYTLAAGPDGVTTITNRPLWVTNALASDKVYDATTAAVLDLSGAGLTNLVNGDDASVSLIITSAAGDFADKNVGTNKTVVISGLSLAGDLGTNYLLFQPTATASITPATLTVSATAANKVYDGGTAETATLSDNKLAGDSLNETYTAAAFADKNAGTNKTVTVSGISASGADIGNYTLGNTTATATADITPATLTITATGVNKVYDGNTTATVTLADNKLAGDDVIDNYASAAFGDKNVATGIAVSVSGLSISGGDAGNYTLASTTASTTADITVRTLAVSATGVNKVYDTTTAATVTLSDDKVSGDDVTDSYTSAAFADPNVGTGKAVSVSGISISGTAVGNYSLANTTASTTADITAASSTTALVSSLNPSTNGSNVTFTATVSSAAGTPTGDVVFLANNVPFSTNTLVAGVAAASTSTLPVGTNTISAQYATQANWIRSADLLSQVVYSAVILSQTNALASITANGDGTYTLNLVGTPGASYYVISSADVTTPVASWTALTYSTNTAPTPSGQWSVVVSNAAPAYYRSVAVNPAP